MILKLYQVDAFTSELFKGNPAAVVPLETWLPDPVLQAIALENNLSETAFFVPEGQGWHLRWFTPVSEVDLCGHATLASAYVLFDIIGIEQDKIRFDSLSGPLYVTKEANSRLAMDFPSQPPSPCDMPGILADAFDPSPATCLVSEDYIAVFDNDADVQKLDPDMDLLKKLDYRGVIATAPGEGDIDFVLRFFAPKYGVPEDPVTGSAFTQLGPFWARELSKTQLTARQLSKRSGDIYCELIDDRVKIAGHAVQYMEGEIRI